MSLTRLNNVASSTNPPVRAIAPNSPITQALWNTSPPFSSNVSQPNWVNQRSTLSSVPVLSATRHNSTPDVNVTT